MSQENVEIVRSIYERWEKGDFSATEWAAPDIDFTTADQRGGSGTDVMANIWGDLLQTMDDFAVVPDQFLEVGDDRVLVLARFRGRGRGSGAPVRDLFGGSLFTLNQAGKVVRLTLFTDRNAHLKPLGLRSRCFPCEAGGRRFSS